MKSCCVVVADARVAKLYLLEEAKELVSGSRLVEQAEFLNENNAARGPDAPGKRSERNTNRQAGPMHPYGEKRHQHRVEIDRRFAQAVSDGVLSMIREWKQGTLMVVADPHMLGLMRDALHGRVQQGVELKELARDYTHLPPGRLHRQLNL